MQEGRRKQRKKVEIKLGQQKEGIEEVGIEGKRRKEGSIKGMEDEIS